MDLTAEKLAHYAAELSYSDITASALHCAKRSFIDSIGCAYGALNAPPVAAVRSLASTVTAAQPATILGTRVRTSPEWAAFVNATMIRYLDFSDDYFGGAMQAGPHPSDNIGAVLAATESLAGDGKALLTGIVVAYEVCCQLLDHAVLAPGGWDYPILHSAASALGAGKVLGLTAGELKNALALAIVPNVCLRQTRKGELSNWKGMAGPNGSRNGFIAALLAQRGITGPSEPFEGDAGFMEQLGSRFELGALGGGDTPFKIEGVSFKYLPVMYSLQLPIWTALDLRSKVAIADIESITAYVDAHVARNDAFKEERRRPQSRETADHSGAYLMAAALVDGGITEETMTPRRYRDPAVLALADKIRVREDKAYSAGWPHTLTCRLEAQLKSGDVITAYQVNPKGHPANPLSDAEIEKKFLQLTAPVLNEAKARTILDTLWNIEQPDDFAKLFGLLAVS